MFPNIPLQWVTAQDLIMGLHAYSGWSYNLSRKTCFLFLCHEQPACNNFLFFFFITPKTFPFTCHNPCFAPGRLIWGAATDSGDAGIFRRKPHDGEKLGLDPERQIGLASIGLKVKRRDNKQEKLPVITGFNIFLFLSDPFLLSLPLFFLSFRVKIPGLRQTY